MHASDTVPWSSRTKRGTRSTAMGWVHSSRIRLLAGPDGAWICRNPPADASVNGPESHGAADGAVPALSGNARRVRPDGGTGNNERATNGGTEAPAPVSGDGTAGERHGSTCPLEHGRPSSAQPKSRRWRRPDSKTRIRRPPTPPAEVEDWEKETQEVVPVDLEKRTFGPKPYGPEDLIRFALRGLSLPHMATPILPLTADYSPAKHHPRPVEWTCYSVPLEKGQFADVDE